MARRPPVPKIHHAGAHLAALNGPAGGLSDDPFRDIINVVVRAPGPPDSSMDYIALLDTLYLADA